MKLPRKRRILCLCNPRPETTSGQRLRSFQRLGQEVIPFDVPSYRPRTKVLAVAMDRMPMGPLIWHINRSLLEKVREHRPDVVWFDKAIHFTPATIEAIRRTGAQTVSYMLDNPFGPRNDGMWHQFMRVFRLFDLHCLVRSVDVARYQAWGLNYIRIMLTFDPATHFPPPGDWSDAQRPRKVSYVGSPYEDRPEFLRRLGDEQQIPLTISGPPVWQKELPPDVYSRYFRDGLLMGDPYREAIWKSQINLSFVTRLNEEDIAHKSVEIAACQGFLMALRTEGHQAIFEEDREAVFFSSVEECADKCRFYLPRPDLREAIARRGRERAVRSGYDNDSQLARVLNRLDGVQDAGSAG